MVKEAFLRQKKRESQTEEEALACACEQFTLYLLATESELVIDDKPFDSLFNSASSKPTPRIEWWHKNLCVELANEVNEGIVKSNSYSDPKYGLNMDHEPEKFCKKCIDC